MDALDYPTSLPILLLVPTGPNVAISAHLSYTVGKEMAFNEEKATALAVFFLDREGGKMEDLKLMKLMYLSERESLRRTGSSITGDLFYSMKNGPVLSHTLDIMSPRDQADLASIWRRHISVPSEFWLKIVERLDPTGYLSEAEVGIASDVWTTHGRKSKWELVDLVHTFEEWVDPLGSSRPIMLQDIFKGLGLNQDLIESRLAELRTRDRFDDLIEEARL